MQWVAWLPDSSAFYIAGMQIDGALYAIVRMEPDGAYELVHSEVNRWMFNPQVSPDGKHLAFATWDFAGQVWLIER